MIATAFTDLCSNELLIELDWLLDQPDTAANRRQIRAYRKELQTREQRRQYLEDNFAWG
jgi:hypothetical protein